MRKALVLILILAVIQKSKGQIPQSCKLLERALNYEKVVAKLKMNVANKDSLLLVDYEGNFCSCDSINWGVRRVYINCDSNLISRLEQTDMFYVLGKDCNYFVIKDLKKNDRVITLSIFRPCSGAELDLKIIKKGSDFKVKWIHFSTI